MKVTLSQTTLILLNMRKDDTGKNFTILHFYYNSIHPRTGFSTHFSQTFQKNQHYGREVSYNFLHTSSLLSFLPPPPPSLGVVFFPLAFFKDFPIPEGSCCNVKQYSATPNFMIGINISYP